MSRSNANGPVKESELAGLSAKEKIFVLKFLETMSIREAAEAAGYSPNYGYAILKKTHVEKALNRLLSDRIMTAEEALVRLTDIARARIDYVISERPVLDQSGNPVLNSEGLPVVEVYIDPAKAIRDGKGHLVKSVAQTHEGFRVTLHDAQQALVTILKFRGAFDKKPEAVSTKGFYGLFDDDLVADPDILQSLDLVDLKGVVSHRVRDL